jgi:ATP-dependent Clp protease ATP-binding subunit ClpA
MVGTSRQAEGMFERFTQRARHTVVLAQEEARQLDHNYIGTEHLLLGLLGEPESVAGVVLARFGITRDAVRAEVTKKVGRGKKTPAAGHIPFTPRAKKTLELSLREAHALRHNYIGTEHILLGLIRESEGVAAQILGEHTALLSLRMAVIDETTAMSPAEQPPAAEEDDENNAVLRWLRSRLSRQGPRAAVPFRREMFPGAAPSGPPTRGTPAVESALEQAARLAGPMPVGSHHLLLAALADEKSAASAALAALGVDREQLREQLLATDVAGTTDEQPEQAGRRQMAIEVSDEMLTVVLTDPVIVAAGKAAAERVPVAAGEAGAGRVIRGDHPAAAGLAAVWLELRKTLAALASVSGDNPRGEAPDDSAADSGEGEEVRPAAGDAPNAPEAGEETA